MTSYFDNNDSYEQQQLLDGSYEEQQQRQQPILIPIQFNDSNGSSDSSDIPEWAMIEVNGEFLPPLDDDDDGTTAENPANNNSVLQIDAPTVELGAVHFRGKVRRRWIDSLDMVDRVDLIKRSIVHSLLFAHSFNFSCDDKRCTILTGASDGGGNARAAGRDPRTGTTLCLPPKDDKGQY